MSHNLMAVILLAAVYHSAIAAYVEVPLLEELDVPSPPDDDIAYLLPQVLAKYPPQDASWEIASDPQLYLLTELEKDVSQAAKRMKRTGSVPSLSIVNPLDVLRQRLLLEIARRRMRQSETQILENRNRLKTVGKREISQSQIKGIENIEVETDNENGDFSANMIEERDVPSDVSRSVNVAAWPMSTSSRWSEDLPPLHRS